ncbi:MAG: ribonuclease III [Lachnospiraceae bacterium]|nr:ribonuclease III [Lachnospiraceae bacterium]
MGVDEIKQNAASAILAKAGIADCKVAELSPLTLAYIGDCAYEILVRTIVIGRGERTVNTMHRHTCRYVNAAAQKSILTILKEDLTEAEQSVVRRGRNAKSHSVAKHATVADYRLATGFEALCGYWYLTGQNERMVSLLTEAIRKFDAASENAESGK